MKTFECHESLQEMYDAALKEFLVGRPRVGKEHGKKRQSHNSYLVYFLVHLRAVMGDMAHLECSAVSLPDHCLSGVACCGQVRHVVA